MISVIIPTFNEKENIKKILVMLQEIKIISEIIFISCSFTKIFLIFFFSLYVGITTEIISIF